jgi:hypothetical protein
MVGDGLMNADEVRAKENMPPQKDEDGNEGMGKKYYISTNVMAKGGVNFAYSNTK